MLQHYGRIGFAAVIVSSLGLVALPQGARAQDPPTENGTGAAEQGKTINLQLENVDLFTVLKLLFSQAKAQWTLDNSLRGYRVNVNFKQPFRSALEIVLKAASSQIPLTYEITNGVYNIIPKQEDPGASSPEPEARPDAQEPDWNPPYKFHASLFSFNAHFLALLLGGRVIPSLPGYNGGGSGSSGFSGGGFGRGGFSGGAGGGTSGGFGGSGNGAGFGGGVLGGGFSGGGGMGYRGGFGGGGYGGGR